MNEQITTKELWEAVLAEMEVSISEATFVTWFKGTSAKEVQGEKLVIMVPNVFARDWLENKFRKKIIASIQKHLPQINSISCEIGEMPSEPKEIIKETFPKENRKRQKQSGQQSDYVVNKNLSTLPNNLNERYSFDNFVVGSHNELAFAACKAVANEPGKNYNPIFVYGGVGLGKTHLLQATSNAILANNPSSKARYISMERFANELLDALENKKAKEFKNRYIQMDILAFDDVQFLAGKEKTQEEFFHIFESLYQAGKQLLLSSDRPAKSIPTLEDRLRSRFEGGMIADVNKPDLETRMAIINTKLKERNFSLDLEIVNYLAENIYHNIRELEGALNKIIVNYQLRNTQPVLTEIIDMTQDMLSMNRQKDLTPKRIINSVAEFYDVKPEEISSRSRNKKVVKPRQVSIYLLRNEIDLSFPEIGKIVGGRDHSTAIYAFEKISEEITTNDILRNQLKFIRDKFIDY